MKLTLTTTQQLLCLRKCSIPGYFSPIQHVLWASLFVYKYSTAMLLSWSSVWMEDWKTLHGQFCLNSASHNSRTDTSWSGLRTNTPLFNCFNKWMEGLYCGGQEVSASGKMTHGENDEHVELTLKLTILTRSFKIYRVWVRVSLE